MLKIAADLQLPRDAQTQTIVVYGGKGMGKTNFAAVIAEELARQKLRFSLLDPVGVSWGLRHAADGKGPGVEALLLGGLHGDMPIEPAAGAVVADLVTDETVSVVIDISRRPDGKMWSQGERIKFVADYAERLFARQGERRRPIMQLIDEAGRFVPQTIPTGAIDIARCVGACEQLVEWGRNVGIGVCLITQRSARMAKSVSELAECMVAFRTIGPHSMDAVLDWLGGHVEKQRAKELSERLRSLDRGHALVVSPGWLKFEGVVAIRKRETFDSSATPVAGKERRATGKAAKPDLALYQERMKQTIERAKADDPKALRTRIAELEKANKALEQRKPAAAPPAKEKRVEVPVLKDAQIARLIKHYERMLAEADRHGKAMTLLWKTQNEEAAGLIKALRSVAGQPAKPALQVFPQAQPKPPSFRGHNKAIVSPDTPAAQPAVRTIRQSPITPPREAGNGDVALRKAERATLRALYWLRDESPDLAKVAFYANYHTRSKGFTNALGKLRSSGLAQGLAITDAGIEFIAADAGERPSGPELRDWLRPWLTGAANRVLDALLATGGQRLSQEELAERCECHPRSKGFTNALGRLRTIEAVEGRDKDGGIKAADVFFAQGHAQ